MSGEHLLLFSRFDIPQSHRLGPTSTGKRHAIGAKCEASDIMFHVTGDRPLMFNLFTIPQIHTVVTPAGKRGAIWTEHDAFDRVCMPGECPLMFTRHAIQ